MSDRDERRAPRRRARTVLGLLGVGCMCGLLSAAREIPLGVPASRLSRAGAPPLTVVTTHGVAFDSLHATPLAGAMISLSGTSHVATSDRQGRFHFENLEPGRYTATLLHAVLDSIGLSGVSASLSVRGASDSLFIAIPSFQRLWRAACGALPVPTDSGFLFGTVRDALSDQVVRGARVSLNFVDVSFDRATKGVRQKAWTGTVETEADGSYVMCGMPADATVRLSAERDSSMASGIVELAYNGIRVQRRDLWMRTITSAGADAVGVVRGSARDRASNRPLENIVIRFPGATEVRTSRDGSFLVRDVPLGTQSGQAIGVGMSPVVASVDIRAGDTATVALTMDKVTTLAGMKVTASSIRQQNIMDMEMRRERGEGDFLDSATAAKFPNTIAAINSLYAIPKKMCAIYVDGRKQFIPRGDSWKTDLSFLSPRDIAQIEVHGWSVPIEYSQGVPCPVLLIWTKLGLP